MSVELWYRFSYDNSSFSEWILYDTVFGGPWEWLFVAPPNGSALHQFFAFAVDHLGHEEDEFPQIFEAEVYVSFPTFTNYLYQGWNLVTLPFSHGWTAESFGQNVSGATIVMMYVPWTSIS